MRMVISFSNERCRDVALAGGKGANLAVLSSGGFAVPPGFCVTTEAYAAFAAEIGLHDRVTRLLGDLAEDARRLEAATSELRDFVASSTLPEHVSRTILDAYSALGRDCYVAVRSSGTAEDLEGASFAGLHDSYLDIHGENALLSAVKQCWASLWTARATSYRRNKGFQHLEASIAVIVQQMVQAEVAGVMFTANPLTSATNEIVINATYGLGEALVSGIATPDEHVLDRYTLRVKEQRVGAKEVQVVRNDATEAGTVVRPVPDEERGRFALSVDQVTELATTGCRVMSLYEGFPQDIEWAIARGKLFVLQARPITGVELSWDEDLEYWPPGTDDTVWSRSWADETWNGAISPLAYSYRDAMRMLALDHNAKIWGIREGVKVALFRYHKGEAYYNTHVHRVIVERTTLPRFRPASLSHTSPGDRLEILNGKLSLARYMTIHARILASGYGPYKWYRKVDDYMRNRVDEANGPSDQALRQLSDAGLCTEFERFVTLKTRFCIDTWTGFFIYARDAVNFLSAILEKWYDGGRPAIFAELLSGLPERTATFKENLTLWRLAQMIRDSQPLTNTFAIAGPRYLQAFALTAEGREFLKEYNGFLAENGHRGHSDRDLYFRRRCEDAAIDFENFRMLLTASSSVDPEVRERQIDERRNAVIVEVEECLRDKPMGRVLVWIFRRLLNYTYRFYLVRDNQRHYFDRFTFSMRRIALEIGRRMAERGVFQTQEDVFFLGRRELYALLRGSQVDPLLTAKIAGRRRNFDRMLHKQFDAPRYLRRGKAVSFEVEDSASTKSLLQGVGTSRGTVKGRARIVTELRNIAQVAEGDILVTQSTDPGWTPVFNLIRGLVLETGGMLAHGSCLAREYGFPAVQLASATRLIRDGAIITVNGAEGSVFIHDDPDAPPS